MTDLNGKVVLVTGGSRGIGAGIVRVLLEAGADVVLHYGRSEAQAREIAHGAKTDRCRLVQADLFEPTAPIDLWEQALSWRGRIDVLVNNAAVRISCGFQSSFDELDQAWTQSMRVNAIAPAHLCRLATSHWRDNAVKSGIIINVSSRPAFRGDRPHFYHDGASKAAVTALTYGMARFCAEEGVSAFVVVPGIIETEQMLDYARHYDVSDALAEIPLREFGQPEDVGKVVAFLASGDARYATGSTIDISGASYIH